MINELFRAYKKIIIAVVILVCAVVFWFFGCHRNENVEENISTWKQETFKNGGYEYKFETNDLTGSVVFGIKGYTVKDKNIPVTVKIQSKKDSFSGLVKITVPGSNTGGISYQSDLQCEKNLTTKKVLSIPQLGNASYFCFEILDQYGNTLLSRMEIPSYSEWKDEDSDMNAQMCLGILSDQFDSLSFMDGMTIDADDEEVKIRMIPLTEKSFPTEEETITMLSGILIDDFSVAKLSKKQINTLMNWVKEGGNLIVATGEYGKKDLNGLKKYLGVTPGETGTGRLYFGSMTDFSGELSLYLNQLKFKENAGWKMVNWSDPSSYYERNYGSGQIQILRFSFTDESILQWNRLKDMTKSLMEELFDSTVETGIDQENGLWSMEMALNDFNISQMPNAFYYGIFFLFYLCLMTFVAYYLLSRMKKREMIWFVVPIMSILLTGCILLRSRGNASQTQSSLSSIRVVDDSSEKNDIFFLYQNEEGESRELNIIPAVNKIIPIDFDYEQNALDYSQLSTIQEEYNISDTSKGYDIYFSETTPGTMRMLQMTENKSMNYGEKTKVFSSDIKGTHTAFSGTVTNESSKDFDKVIVIRANEYWCTKKVKAGEVKEISEKDVHCWNQSDEDYVLSQENDKVVIQDISNYILYQYMKNNSDQNDVIVIGITLKDDYSVLRNGNQLGNEISVYVNHTDIEAIEKCDYIADINEECAQNHKSFSEIQSDIMEEPEVEIKYQFDTNKLLWALARNHDNFTGKIYAYNYKQKKKEEILSKPDDIMYCEELEPYLSDMNIITITYVQSEEEDNYEIPILSGWLKKTMQQ